MEFLRPFPSLQTPLLCFQHIKSKIGGLFEAQSNLATSCFELGRKASNKLIKASSDLSPVPV